MILLPATFSSIIKDSDFTLSLSSSQQERINFLRDFFSPYTTRVYIVGGFLRDNLLNIYSDDIDLEIYDISQEFFLELMEKLQTKELSKKFFVYDYKGIDISLPRVETKVLSGYHGFDIKLTDNEKEASLRRDFTCNTLMYNIYTNKLLDIYNSVDDINNMILKIVNPQKFSEDSLRLIRAVRFMAQFGFKIDENSKQVLRNMNLDEISKSRINKEIQKLFI